MRSLDTLVRLHRFKVDEIRRDLAALARLVDELTARDGGIVSEIARERGIATADPDAGRQYGRFIAGALERRGRLARSRAELEQRIAVRHEDLRAAFTELKRHEQLRDQRARRETEARERKAALLLDEIALDMHRRNAG